jgi:hypothetical protein
VASITKMLGVCVVGMSGDTKHFLSVAWIIALDLYEAMISNFLSGCQGQKYILSLTPKEKLKHGSSQNISGPSKMNFPTDIPRRINPQLQDPAAHSVIYSFQNENALEDARGYIVYKLPYSPNTFWTNFKYSYYGLDNPQIEIGIELDTSNDYNYQISYTAPRAGGVWHDTVWPLPSLNNPQNNGSIYIKVRVDSAFQRNNFRLFLLGFTDLFPPVDHYLLLSSHDTYQFVFHMNHGNEYGTIFNVENFVYVQDLVNDAYGIRLISRY